MGYPFLYMVKITQGVKTRTRVPGEIAWSLSTIPRDVESTASTSAIKFKAEAREVKSLPQALPDANVLNIEASNALLSEESNIVCKVSQKRNNKGPYVF